MSCNKILFVDDDACLLEAMRRMFRRRFVIATAHTVDEALALLAADGPFAVVVSDQSMGGTSGTQFLREVGRRSPGTARILLTGGDDIPLAEQNGLFRLLAKPCPRESLQHALEAGLKAYRSRLP